MRAIACTCPGFGLTVAKWNTDQADCWASPELAVLAEQAFVDIYKMLACSDVSPMLEMLLPNSRVRRMERPR